jgi:predicted O-methyltransferase YrrM
VSFLRFIKVQIGKVVFLIRADAPLWLIVKCYRLNLRDKLSAKRKNYLQIRDNFRNKSKSLHIDNDWFTSRIPTWLSAFERSGLSPEKDITCLEVGSWQGLSTFFTLSYFNKASITCVDTWEGADEHQSGDAVESAILESVETIFDKNLAQFSNRIEKFKGTSYAFFNDKFERDKFDLIYIDGSHHSDDVVIDAIKAFEMLKVGGVMILDDYLWIYYDREIDNPAGAINSFLRLKRHQIEFVCLDYQVIIRKMSSSIRWAE